MCKKSVTKALTTVKDANFIDSLSGKGVASVNISFFFRGKVELQAIIMRGSEVYLW